MINDIVMDGLHDEAITWLINYVNTANSSLKDSTDTFFKYYISCLNELKTKKYNDAEIKEAANSIDTVREFLSKHAYFRNLCLKSNTSEEALAIITDKDLEAILSIPSSISTEDKIKALKDKTGRTEEEILEIIGKINRYYNMQLKLSHTARITYIAIEEVERLNIKDEKIRNAVITSALMHDIGRFYQAINYNTLSDDTLKKSESKIKPGNSETIDLEVDHAVAGYYYALVDLYALNATGSVNYEDIVYHAIASIVVRFHQKANFELKEFQTQVNSFEFGEDFDEKIVSFLCETYKKAPLLIRQKSKYNYDENHLTFIDEVIKEIIKQKKAELLEQYKIATSGVKATEEDMERFSQMFESSERRVHEIISKLEKQENKTELENMIFKIKTAMSEAIGETFITEEEIEDVIRRLADYDIAHQVDSELKASKDNVPEDIRKLLYLSLSLTMDADKLDIFNQRAIGIYNTSYNPASYSVYPAPPATLIDILNKHFAFRLDKNELYLTKDLIYVIEENTSKETKEYFKSIGIDLNALKSSPETLRIDPNSEFYRIIAVNPWKNLEHNESRTKRQYNIEPDKVPMPTVKVSRDIILSNVSEYQYEDQIKVFEQLIIAPEEIDKFQLSSNFSLGVSKLQDEYQGYNQEYITWNPVKGLIWQINQFILVNMRSVKSYEFMQNRNILEKIYSQYNDNHIIQEIIRPYIAYAMFFIDYIQSIKTDGVNYSQTAENDNYKQVILYDDEFMAKMRLQVAELVKNNPDILNEYHQRLINYNNSMHQSENVSQEFRV